MDTKKSNNNILKGYNLLFYFAGSMIMHEPSQECIVDFWEKGILKSLPVNSSNPNFVKAASQLRESFTDRNVFGKLLHEDFVKLFTLNSHALAPAFESHYNHELSSYSNFNAPNVTEFYDSYGWKSRFKGKINDDHLGIELLFLTLLIDKYLQLDDEACIVEMRGEIRRFIKTHILSWVPIWNSKIQKYASTLSFKGIGNLILACAEDIFILFDQKYTRAPSSNAFKN